MEILNMITVSVNKENERVTFSATVNVDGRDLALSVTKHLGYQSKDDLDNPTFDETFYWSESAYTNSPKHTHVHRGKMQSGKMVEVVEHNHHMYKRLVETGYSNQSGDWYEVQWKVMAKEKYSYDDLDRHFKCPAKWQPGKQAFFDHYKRIPRKLKKKWRGRATTSLPLKNKMWDVLYQENPNYCRFLIKQITKHYEIR
jgi:hypothetical protein